MKLFKELTPEETIEFKQWARDTYRPYEDIKGIWHLVIQEECVQMNKEEEAKNE